MKDLKTRCKEFFESLTEKTGTYFLSDYVENIEDYLDKQETSVIVANRDSLRNECESEGLDFHNISCHVASDFLHKNNLMP
jgi:hypothetical protein